MIAYIDTSVLMRVVLAAPNPLVEWPDLQRFVTSSLLRVEALRALDQLRHWGKLTDQEVAEKMAKLYEFMPRFTIVAIDELLLDLASRPLPTSLATLDSIHLASALTYRAAQPPDERPLLFATHDSQLARAARAMNFEVLGA